MSTPSAMLLGALLAFLAASLHGCGGSGGGSTYPKMPVGTTVVVGSGGCDGQDTHCKDDPSAEKVLKFLTIDKNGTLHDWTSMSDLRGNAAWFATRLVGVLPSRYCVFVTYPGASIIEAFHVEVGKLATKAQMLHLGDKNANPVYGDISSDGNTLVVANYHGPDDQTSSKGASVQTFSISVPDCHLTPADLKPHSGSSVDKKRQGAAHPHSTVVGRNNLVFVCDLGMDIIFTYNISSSGKLTELARTATQPGSGPRHSMLHPTADYLFVVSEMGSTLSSYHIEQTGKLTLIENVTTLPGEDPKSYGSKAAELAITPDGKHLYVSNRAFAPKFKDTVAVFDISSDGKLTLTQQVPCPAYPRGMMLMPDGKFLLVASQTNGEVASFKVDAKTGHLTPTNSTQKGPWGAAAFAVLPNVTSQHPFAEKGSDGTSVVV